MFPTNPALAQNNTFRHLLPVEPTFMSAFGFRRFQFPLTFAGLKVSFVICLRMSY